MAENPALVAQVRISNLNPGNPKVPRVLSIRASRLFDYVKQLIAEGNKRYEPARASQFEYLPLMSVRDLADTGEEVIFKTPQDLPKQTVVNSKGVPILIILPEDNDKEIGINSFESLTEEQQTKMNDYIKSVQIKKKDK